MLRAELSFPGEPRLSQATTNLPSVADATENVYWVLVV
jgi:hypothetical protein